MRQSIAVSTIGLLLLAGSASAIEPGADANIRHGFAKCRAMEDDHERLRCYDKLTNLLSPPRWEGRLTAQTENFEITAPTVLRYESDGPIFVMYLKDGQGGIVQNLHIGGGGTSTYVIEKPGTYSLQVSGSETWRIWLDPMS